MLSVPATEHRNELDKGRTRQGRKRDADDVIAGNDSQEYN